MPNDNDKSPVMGVSRVGDNDQALLVHFRERPTDAQLRALHDLGKMLGGGPFTWERWATEDDGFDMETGAPGIATFANAVQMWAINQPGGTSVAMTAMVFNVEPRRIIEAVEWHHYMLLAGPHDDYSRLVIEHDGE